MFLFINKKKQNSVLIYCTFFIYISVKFKFLKNCKSDLKTQNVEYKLVFKVFIIQLNCQYVRMKIDLHSKTFFSSKSY